MITTSCRWLRKESEALGSSDLAGERSRQLETGERIKGASRFLIKTRFTSIVTTHDENGKESDQS